MEPFRNRRINSVFLSVLGLIAVLIFVFTHSCSEVKQEWTLAAAEFPWVARDMAAYVMHDNKMWILGGGGWESSLY